MLTYQLGAPREYYMTSTTKNAFLTSREHKLWRVVQTAFWLVGLVIIIALIVSPDLGLILLWSVLIPVAPALLVFAPGLWRNVCPLGSTALLSRHIAKKPRRKMSVKMQGILTLLGVGLLLILVPLRHVILDTSANASALVLIATGVLAICVCSVYEWKSAWCSGMCPVHPVEKLYGQSPGISFKNAHCHSCHRCVQVCPDSTPEMSPLVTPDTKLHRLAGLIMVGGFVGFIWGWFHVPDYASTEGWQHLTQIYAWPLLGLTATLTLYLLLQRVVGSKYKRTLAKVFAGAAVACYYWYRLPGLAGFGLFPGDGMLVDLTSTVPEWTVLFCQVALAALLFLWIVSPKQARKSWTKRPPFATITVEKNLTVE